MNKELRQGLLTYTENLLTLKGWHNISEPNLFYAHAKGASRNLYDYIPSKLSIIDIKNNKELKLLIETLENYNNALDDDWLPDYIEGLSIKKAYLFLQEIKHILETNIYDSQIEEVLIKVYHKIKSL